jgi:cell division protein FtsB
MKKLVITLILCMFLISFACFAYAEGNQAGEQIKNQISQLKDDFQQLKEKQKEFKQNVDNFKADLKELLKDKKETKLNLGGKNITVKELSDEKKELIANKINAKTGLNLTVEDIENKTMLRAYLSNGKNAIIKVMPDTASQRAIERLNLKFCNESNSCTIELKGVGEGNQTKAVYEIKAKKEKRFLFFWKRKVDVQAEVDAEAE